jgi:hypothetical protein
MLLMRNNSQGSNREKQWVSPDQKTKEQKVIKRVASL